MSAKRRSLTIEQALDALIPIESLIDELRTEFELNEGVSDHTIGYLREDPAEDLIRNCDDESAARKLVKIGLALSSS